jgi:rhodanese-related sulfurtransferase
MPCLGALPRQQSFEQRTFIMRAALKAGTMVLMLAVAPVGIAVTPLGTSTPVLADMNMDWPDSVNQFVMQIRKSIQTTDMDGYLAAVKNPKGALLLDVREEGEFKAGHVPAAVNIPRGLLEFRIWKQIGFPTHVDMNRKIYVQCQTGGRATLATKQLQDIGFTNVIAVIMNFEEWQKKGNPLS